MKRRDFITLLGGAAAAWPLGARAQQPGMRRIGVLIAGLETDPEMRAWVQAFQRALERLGWHDGRNAMVEIRWGTGGVERLRSSASELIALAPAVILSTSNEATTLLSGQTNRIPIVFASVGDPLETGLITNMVRPGGNVTGFVSREAALAGKFLELLKEAAASLTRVAVLYNRDSRIHPRYIDVVRAAAPSLGIQAIIPVPVNDPAEIERDIDAFSHEANGGLIVLTGPPTRVNRETIIGLAEHHRLPAIYSDKTFVTEGGLMSYGADLIEQFRLSASYVDRILRGEKPGDLPVQAPTKFELVINSKAANAIRLAVPPVLLARADQVIE